MPPNRTPATKRACDGCKIRKIRCGGGHPCPACTNARIKCTYIRVQQPRGPQKLRATTKYLIDQAQRGTDAQEGRPEPAGDAAVRNVDSSDGSRIPINLLASPLYIYHVRMYPVWPIVDVESVISRLRQAPDADETTETYALATAVAAATIAQLRLGHSAGSEKSCTADAFAAECLRARSSSGYRARLNLHTVRTAFFLHVYYENQHSGGSESLLYLREAISLAQMMHLHRESAYRGLPAEEQQMRRRVLWLLFVTERGVCILHKLPVVLKTNISTPELDVNDEPQVLPAFLKLLTLFRLFEQSDMFRIIEDDDPDPDPDPDHHPGMHALPARAHHLDRRFFDLLQDNRQDGSTLLDRISDVQKADLCVTRHWMRMILWRFSAKTVGPSYPSYPSSGGWPTSPAFPVRVAKDLLDIVSQLPRPAIEAHGLGMELKLYEIANSLADAVMNLAVLPSAPAWDGDSRPSSILARLHSILSTFRGGGNKELVEMLYRKMAEAQSRSGPTLYTQVTTRASRRKALAEPVKRHEDTPSVLQSATGHGSASECFATASHLAPSGSANGDQAIGTGCRASHDIYSVGTTSNSLGQFFQPVDAVSAQTFDSVLSAYMQSSWETEHTPDPGFARLSPCLQSNAVDALLDDFISQVPNDYSDNIFPEEGFTSQTVPVDGFLY